MTQHRVLTLSRNFADNVGIKFYTPEEYFLQEVPRPFVRALEPSDHIGTGHGEYSPHTRPKESRNDNCSVPETFLRRNPQDIVLFCGSPGAGKSTFYWKHLEPLGYARVNQDTLKSVCCTTKDPDPNNRMPSNIREARKVYQSCWRILAGRKVCSSW